MLKKYENKELNNVNMDSKNEILESKDSNSKDSTESREGKYKILFWVLIVHGYAIAFDVGYHIFF